MKSIYAFLLVSSTILAVNILVQDDYVEKKGVIALDVGVVVTDNVGEVAIGMIADYFAEETGEVVKYFEPGAPKPTKGYTTVALKPPIGFI